MIRFSCPGCGATYSVDDSKAGKTGKCPKCQTQFQIPVPEGVTAPPATGTGPAPTLPPADPNAPVEIAPCPGCQARLSVSTSDLGADVECPYCKTVYKAVKPGTGVSAVAPKARSERDEDRPSRRRDEDDEDDRPRRRRREEDDEDRPSRRRRDEDNDDDRPSRRRRDEDNEDEEDRPRRRKRRRGGSYEPHRGGLILTLGILSLVACGIFTGLPAWLMGRADLEKMDAGRMDPEGRVMTNVGKILGMINVILTVVGFLFYCVLFAIIGIGGRAGR